MAAEIAVMYPGNSLEYGLLRINYSGDGVLEACDPYGCSRFRITGRSPVKLYPAHPVNRPQRIASCIYIEFEEELVIEKAGRAKIYLVAPFDVELRVEEIAVAKLTPTIVKYTIVGDIVDGHLCRYYRSKAAQKLEELGPGPGEAIVEANIRGHGVLRGIGFSVEGATIYVGKVVAYARLEVELGAKTVTVRSTGKPPLEDMKPSPATPRRVLPIAFTHPI